MVRRAFALPSATTQTVHVILPSGMLRDHSEAALAPGSMIASIAAVPDMEPALQVDIERAFAEGALVYSRGHIQC